MVFVRPFPRLAVIGAFLAAAALLLGFSAPAHAQVLVSNTGQTTHGHTACVDGSELLGACAVEVLMLGDWRAAAGEMGF